jgi:hypothetical protein
MPLVLTICLALVAWTIVPLPLAVVVGRLLRAEGAGLTEGSGEMARGPELVPA